MEYIFKYKDGRYNGQYFWNDYIEECCEDEFDVDYVVVEHTNASFHTRIKSALYDDMIGYQDELQEEHLMDSNELYIVTYYKYDNTIFLEQCVDFGITKEEIIANVYANKYVEGACYYTIGQMMKTTKDWLESGKYIEHDC